MSKPEQEIVYLNPKDLVPYEMNFKKHPQSHIETLKTLMQRYGFSKGNAIQVDKNMVIIAGHGRREAACQLGLERVPVIVRADLNDDEVKRWRIEENKSVGLDYDVVMMKEEISHLLDIDEDPLIGFDQKEWSVLTEDLTANFNSEQMLTDLDEEMAESSRKHDEAVEAAKTSEVAITDLLGFRKVPASHQRNIVAFMADVEERTGKTGMEAFVAFAETHLFGQEGK